MSPDRPLKFFPDAVFYYFKKLWDAYLLLKWKLRGKPLPPPHLYKQMVIKSYQEKYKPGIFVETGTLRGDMVYAMRKRFEKIYSIELSHDLCEAAKDRFSSYKHIDIVEGDSGKVLSTLLPGIKERAIFWLDGHYSSGSTARGEKDCPVIEEMTAIFASGKRHIILIDDARDFNSAGDYPSLETLTDFVNSRTKAAIKVENDIIRVLPED